MGSRGRCRAGSREGRRRPFSVTLSRTPRQPGDTRDMSSIRVQITGGSEHQSPENEEPRPSEALKERTAVLKPREPDSPSKVQASLPLAWIIAMLWVGAALAFLWGFFKTLPTL